MQRIDSPIPRRAGTPLAPVPEDEAATDIQLPLTCFACARDLGWPYFAPQQSIWQAARPTPFPSPPQPWLGPLEIDPPIFERSPSALSVSDYPFSPSPIVPAQGYFDGPLTPHDATSETQPILARAQAPSPAALPLQSDPAAQTPHPFVQPVAVRFGASRGSQRQRRRRTARRELCERPLHATTLGRSILALRHCQWHMLDNGIATTRFDSGQSAWRANDMANCINWLRCGAYAHRSLAYNVIGIVNLDRLNEVITQCGHPPITTEPGLPDWTFDVARGTPMFMRHNFVSRHASPRP